MDFALFILVNAVLFVRPGEIVPALLGMPVFEVTILACAAASAWPVVRTFSSQPLRAQPITICVFGVFVFVVLSHLSHFFLWGVRDSGTEFLKVLTYYVLLVATVNTPARLRQFTMWLVLFAAVLTGLSVLEYHQVIALPTTPVGQVADGDPNATPVQPGVLEHRELNEETGEEVVLYRLRGTGIFGDPNDFSLLLMVASTLCLYWLTDAPGAAWRPAWLALLLLFGYALMLTQSRGGFMALVGSLAFLFYARFGLKKSLPLAVICLPVLRLLFGGRQTEISTGEETSRERLQLWSEALLYFREEPLFGIGASQFSERAGIVVHNSFLQAFTELGVAGGALFLGAFLCALLTYRRLGRLPAGVPCAGLQRLRPYLAALSVGFVIGLQSLSRGYVIPTYLVLGLGAATGRIAQERLAYPVVWCDVRLIRRLALAAVLFLGFIYVFVRLFVRFDH